MSNTANGSDNGPLDEVNVTAEVDRMLKSINVNGFIKDDKTDQHSAEPTGVDPTQESTATQPPSYENEATPKHNGTTPHNIPPVTSMLANFISTATPSLLAPDLRLQLQECLLDFIAVAASGATIAPSSQPILSGLLAFMDANASSTSSCTVITRGRAQPPYYAGLLNATYAHSLDFDDTHVESTLHAGVTAIATALAESESILRNSRSSPTSSDILLAILLGYETTIRIGIALSTASYARGFHNTSTAGIFGAVAVISSLRRLKPATIVNAFGLAGSKAAGSMQYLANGSHNKRLHPGFAVHDAFLCVSLAEAGVIGAEKIIEGDLGLLQAYTDRERSDMDWSRLSSDLGSRWEFADSALKPYAGCRMTHAFIELADSLGQRFRSGAFTPIGAKRIAKIRCLMPKANMILIGQRQANKVHPENMVDAQFSCYFQVANAVLFGGSHDMAAYDRLHDPDIKEMCERVECLVDENVKRMGARMEVFLEDGNGEVVEVVRRDLGEPLGERRHPFVREKVEEKFMGLMRPVYGEERSREVMKLVYEIGDAKEGAGVVELLDLLAVPTK